MGDDGSEIGPSENESTTTTTPFLQIFENPDGSLTRPLTPLSSPVGENQDTNVHSKDVLLNPSNKTWLRIYRPNLLAYSEKLPIILYFHGGGFVLFSAASGPYDAFCEQMARAVPALVVSLDYRLAPEHRLPAAYDDAVEALLWVQAQAKDTSACDPWIANRGDFACCFLMGSSSGANMAYQTVLRAAALELDPVGLAGVILYQPYFGGLERTSSEQASEEDAVLPLRANDMLWHLSLPEGANRSHEFCDPTAAPPSPSVLSLLPRCLVKGCEGDPLIDRQREFARMLDGAGANVVARLNDKGFHAIELFVPAVAQALFDEVRDFMSDA